MKYTFPKGTPRKYLALGSYPKQSLRSIRDKALWAKNLVADGKDPKQEKLIEAMGLNKDDSFRRVCREYFEQEWKPNKSKTHVKRFEALLERLLKGSIGRLSISAINEQMLRERLLPIRNSSQDQANRLCRWLANTYTDNQQSNHSVAALKEGGFFVTWTSMGQDGDGTGIFGQFFDNNGSKSGSEFQINAVSDDYQVNPKIAELKDGSLAVVWQDFDSDVNPDAASIWSRTINLDRTLSD